LVRNTPRTIPLKPCRTEAVAKGLKQGLGMSIRTKLFGAAVALAVSGAAPAFGTTISGTINLDLNTPMSSFSIENELSVWDAPGTITLIRGTSTTTYNIRFVDAEFPPLAINPFWELYVTPPNSSGVIFLWLPGVTNSILPPPLAQPSTLEIFLHDYTLQTLVPIDGAPGSFSFTGTDVVGIPAPIAGAGLPGLVFVSGGLLAWWHRRRN
jgi:hypothetical protein